jgi:hypothetical protein
MVSESRFDRPDVNLNNSDELQKILVTALVLYILQSESKTESASIHVRNGVPVFVRKETWISHRVLPPKPKAMQGDEEEGLTGRIIDLC